LAKNKLTDAAFYVTKRVGRAVHEHGLLPDGCTALVALSGGVGSLGLLRTLVAREERVPTRASFVPCYLPDGRHGQPGQVAQELARCCRQWGLELVVGPEPAAPFLPALPYRPELTAVATERGASVIVLGQTMRERALALLLDMVREGRLGGLPVKEEVDGPAGPLLVVRPLCHVTPQAMEELARADGLPVLPLLAEPPDGALNALLDRYIEDRQGRLIEAWRNITSAPDHIEDEYLG